MQVPSWRTPTPPKDVTLHDDSDVETVVAKHKNLSITMFVVGFLFFPVWWAGFFLAFQDRGKNWDSSGLAKALNIGSAVFGTASTCVTIGIVVTLALGGI